MSETVSVLVSSKIWSAILAATRQVIAERLREPRRELMGRETAAHPHRGGARPVITLTSTVAGALTFP